MTILNKEHLEARIKVHFDAALEDPQNTEIDGSINWNFVDADIFMGLSDEGTDVCEDETAEFIINFWNDLAEAWENAED